MTKLVRGIQAMAAMAALMMMVALLVVGTAEAGDKLINTTIDSVVTKLDKNGNKYTRAIIKEERELSGVKYQVGVAVMAFGTNSGDLASYKPGDALKAVVAERQYKGRLSYTLRAIVQ